MTVNGTNLQTYITANEPEPTLAALTRFGESDTSTINTTILLEYCEAAIRQFETDFLAYDATNYPVHQDVARYLVLRALWGRTHDANQVEEIDKKLAPLVKNLMRRRFMPRTNETSIPTTPTPGRKPHWDSSTFDGYRID